jgi:Glutamine amidotransferases class-II
MCQAIAKPAGAVIYRRHMALAWQQNPDGAGFAWRDENGTVMVSRGYFDFVQFWKAVREHNHQDVLIHLRLATHGKKCLENCHPFIVDDNVVMAHNGIIHEFTADTKGRSDSRAFVEDVLIPAVAAAGSWEQFWTPGVQKLLENLIGWSRLLFLTSNGFAFVNEIMGTWTDKTGEGKVWWSAGMPTPTSRYGWDDEDDMMYGTHSVTQAGLYAEGSAEWLAFLTNKYGEGKVERKYGMPCGTLSDQAEFRAIGKQYATAPQMTVFDQTTGAPIRTEEYIPSPGTLRAAALAKRQPLPDWVYNLAPNSSATLDEIEDMIERGVTPEDIAARDRDDEIPSRWVTMDDDALVNAYIRNKGDD